MNVNQSQFFIIGHKKERDIIHAVCHDIDPKTLNEFVSFALYRMKLLSNNDAEVVNIVDEKVMTYLNVLSIGMKKLILFYMLNIDTLTRDYICNNSRHEYLSVPYEIQKPFFLGLGKLCEQNIELVINDNEFVSRVSVLYDIIAADRVKCT